MRGQVLVSARAVETAFVSQEGRVLTVVDDVSLELRAGRTVGIVGESGSGKSVLLRTLMGLVRSSDVRLGGSVNFTGVDTVNAPMKQVRRLWGRTVSIILQDPMTALNPVRRIGTQLVEPMRVVLGMKKADARTRAVSLLRAVGIPDAERRLRAYPHELSGGQLQRVSIAAALACSPQIVFADEPTTALDVTVQAQILDLLQKEQRDLDLALVIVTHDLGVAAGRTDEIVVMYAGQIVEHAETRALFGNMKMPYTEALLASIPRLSDPSQTRLAAIDGSPPDPASWPERGCRFAARCKYAREKCREETPQLVPSPEDPGHLYRCWFPLSGAPASEASPVRAEGDTYQSAATGGS
ncbi:ABC transporter ATP-binding protein [Nocardioides sp. cx-169]|uniref:ABC transporter ATP-binding protein n=1 Tax=Nocardioides sp. cx-169 TaxID=2899080 RepID=UPI001E61ADEC|nr:ABC transporter ATP-binding protein [Nocardioides sp. cx-169]MCD4536594.1 ABC transporter ATP-binding protein [Nocardioides sp. cx-169]